MLENGMYSRRINNEIRKDLGGEAVLVRRHKMLRMKWQEHIYRKKSRH